MAVVAHTGKRLGGGPEQLRTLLAAEGISDPLWYEVAKSKKAPPKARKALKAGADLVFVWGGDGMVQRCVDALAGSGAVVAIIPAGTANLLATNLGIPRDLDAAAKIGLHGERRQLDVGVVNGERFVVMAGTGFDALMIRDADGTLKDRFGRVAYLWTGAKHLRAPRVKARVTVDGARWFKGKVSCVLLGNVGRLIAGITAFEEARPDDGVLELGVVTADGAWQWMRALARTAAGAADHSKFVQTASGRAIDIRLARPLPYEIDGGDRPPTKRLRVSVERGALTVSAPERAVP